MKALKLNKLYLFFVLWAIVATILLISNTIGVLLSGGSSSLFGVGIYHFVASLYWIVISYFLIGYFSKSNRTNFKYLVFSFSFYPLVITGDTLIRGFLRFLFIGIDFSFNALLTVFFTLVDANFLIYGCLSLFIYYSINMTKEETNALRDATLKWDQSNRELEDISALLPPDFLIRNLDRILIKYKESYEKGEDLIVKFSDFLRLAIYGLDDLSKENMNENYFLELSNSYEVYISSYLESNVRILFNTADEIFIYDKLIE